MTSNGAIDPFDGGLIGEHVDEQVAGIRFSILDFI